jgi:hypothetical protein
LPGHDFRQDARAAVKRARALMAEDASLPTLRYAALETRLAMEALTYDRAQAYGDDFPKWEIGTWQPRKLLLILLGVDPMADTEKSFNVSKEPANGAPQDNEDWFDFGTETVLNLAAIKEQYDAIGSRLHMPTIKQLESGETHDPERLRRRLEGLLTHLEAVLASPIFNLTMIGRNSKITCMRCDHRVRKATKGDAEATTARCPGCGLGYDLVPNADGDFDWYPERTKMKCGTPSCPEELIIYRDELRPGLAVNCEACGKKTLIVFGSRRAEQSEDEAKGPTLQVKDT